MATLRYWIKRASQVEYRIYGDISGDNAFQLRVDGIEMGKVSRRDRLDIMVP